MRDKYSVTGGSILNKFIVPEKTSTNTMAKFNQLGWIDSVDIRLCDKAIIAHFKNLHAN